MSRLLFFLPSLQPGGAEGVWVKIANQMSFNHEVHFAYGITGSLETTLSERVERHDLGAARALSCLTPLVEVLGRVEPDWLLATLNYANVVAVWSTLLSDKPIKVALRESTSWERFDDQRNTCSQRVLPAVLPSVYRQADLVLAPSIGIQKQLVERGVQTSLLANPVIDQDLFRLSQEPSTCRRPFVLAVGRLVWEKGFDALLESWAISGLGATLDLVILGEGPERERLEGLATHLGVRGSVKMPGFDTNPFRYMANAELCVLSSRHEGMPNVLIQALACGARVVATDCKTGPREVLEDGKWGQLVPVDDIEALADGLEVGLNSPKPQGIDLSAYQAKNVAAELERMLEEFDA
ncbi:glycosyltransferase [Microvenator marinus]|uniref:Glycosyltransferase n=1 Tax=Microvenator marinus TaxID=2600177 RepID=A0A5B8XZ32_9DELT|nr:glycosyltransferase [Microvenator marinus]QED28709.1 glycosyltransferase [Microvenator marinus]